MQQSELKLKTAMYLYHGRSMTLNRNLCTKLNRISEKANRNKKIHLFSCKNCGYKSNDDRIGAMNLYRMGINYLADSSVSETESQVPGTVTAE